MTDKPWVKSYDPGLPHTLQPYPEKTILDVLDETLQLRPDATALIFKGRTMSYAQIQSLSDAVAAALTGLGVQRGERVALLLPNSPQALIAQLGAWKAGTIVSPLNPLYTEHELTHALQEIGAETVVALNPFYAKVKRLQSKTSVRRVITSHIKDFLPAHLALLFTLVKEKKEGYRIRIEPGDVRMVDLLKQYAGKKSTLKVQPSDPALLLFSGGTTGTPKAVLAAHRSLLISALQLRAYASKIVKDWEDSITLFMPIFHVYGNMGMNTALVGRWPMILIPNPRDLDDLVATVNKTRPSMLHGVPTLFNALIQHPAVRSGKVDLKSIKVCYSAAAPLMAETKRAFEAITGGRLLEAYAMTETILAAVVCPTQGEYKVGSTGIPLPDVELRIVDTESGAKDLPAGQAGEVLIRAPQIMEGYWGRPDETSNMIRDGWVYTGDIGYLDEDGYLFLIDRKKDVIKPSGFQVWPREVEEVISAHPAVLDVCVGGVPDPAQGEAVKAWVVLLPGKTLSEQAIKDFCREKLAGYKVPRQVEFREILPKSMVGKTLRRVLVEGMAQVEGVNKQ